MTDFRQEKVHGFPVVPLSRIYGDGVYKIGHPIPIFPAPLGDYPGLELHKVSCFCPGVGRAKGRAKGSNLPI